MKNYWLGFLSLMQIDAFAKQNPLGHPCDIVSLIYTKLSTK
jgi:hypothetical protein